MRSSCGYTGCFASIVTITAGNSITIPCCYYDIYVVLDTYAGVATGMSNSVSGCGQCGTWIQNDQGTTTCGPTEMWYINWYPNQTVITN